MTDDQIMEQMKYLEMEKRALGDILFRRRLAQQKTALGAGQRWTGAIRHGNVRVVGSSLVAAKELPSD